MLNKIIIHVLFGLICFLIVACSPDQDKIMPKESSGLFENICAGRYMLDIPVGSKLISGYFGNDAFHLSLESHSAKNENAGVIIDGDDRLSEWEGLVEKARIKDDLAIKYVDKELKGQTKYLSYYSLFEYNSKKTHMIDTFFYRDFPRLNLAVAGKMNFNLRNFDSSITAFQEFYRKNLEFALAKQEQIIHQPWPHNQLGVCLNSEILVNTPTASEEEVYHVMWHNGKKSLIEIDSEAYAKGEDAALKKKMSYKYKLLDSFANTGMVVAGRQGKVVTSSGGYSESRIQFTWFSTDAKAGSTRLPYLKISGYVEMKDFPEIAAKGLNETDLAIGWLKSIQVRENGMVGTR